VDCEFIGFGKVGVGVEVWVGVVHGGGVSVLECGVARVRVF